jgi:CheY-like chemotaxis protein
MKTLCVYLAEDSVEITMLVKLMLKKDNIHVVSFENGKDCFDALMKCAKNPTECVLPTLIISDINMPVMNGHEMIAAIHAEPILRGIPILVHSSEAEVKDRIFDTLEGVFNIRKPSSPSEFRAYVGELLAGTQMAINA